MVEFTPIENRDAYQVIRGYVYQVDLTIERWLELAPDQVLELECGEDIDTVSSALMSEERDRFLEQVKHCESPLTLRRREALKALVCAVASRGSNADISLTFRYTTNAEVKVERPPIFDRRTPAIEMWEKIRTDKLDEAEQQQAIDKLVTFLANAAKPKDVSLDIWQEFPDFIASATNAEFMEFVKVFEWSTGCTQAPQMQPKIRALLIGANRAVSKQDAEIKYQRLFLFVFKLLCQKGTKRLTPAELEEQLTLPALSTQDLETLSYVQDMLASLEARMSIAERSIEANKRSIGTLYPIVQKLAKDHGIDPDIRYTPIEPVIDMPPLVAHASKRKETISQIVDELKDHTWIALKGTVGTGKTQLAILLAQQLGDCRAWICFRGKKNEAACSYLDRSIELMTGDLISVSGRPRFKIACEALKVGDLIVLDDIPALHNNQDLSTRLLLLLEECASRGIRIISTSTVPPPDGFCSVAGDRLKLLDVPPFTQTETYEVLEGHGATSKDAETWSSAVNTLASGHPILIVAIARYLRGVSWRISLEQFDSLFVRHEYANGVNPDTVRRLLDTVEDPDYREFLYRLNLIVYNFTTDDAKAVASIKPSVQRPNEKLTLLDGLWIQRMSGNSYMVSPLVKRLGSGDLPPQRQKAINYVLGLGVLARRHLNQWDAFSAVSYFLKAETYQNAMLVLMRALFVIAEQEEISDDACLGFIWKDTPLPPDTDMGLRIFLRSLQLAVNRRLGRDVKILYTDLVNLIEAAELEDCWSLFHATFEIIRYTEAYGDNWNSVHKAISKSIVSFPEAIMADGTKLASICEIGPEKFIWLVVPNITKPEQLIDWIEMVATLPTQAIQKAFEGQDADEACVQLSYAVWASELEKPKGSQRWAPVLEAFDIVARKADELQLFLLWACAQRAQMIILNECVGDFDAAVALAEKALTNKLSDPRVQYLMREYIGQEYYLRHMNEEARVWLEEAAKYNVKLHPMGRIRTFGYLSALVGNEDPVKGLNLIQTAYGIAQGNQQVPQSDIARILGEHAIAHWLKTSDVTGAFDMLDEAGENLLECRKDDVHWKALARKLAHVAVYFSGLALRGEPPKPTNGKSYDRPFRGMFFVGNDEVTAQFFQERDVWMFMAQMANFAAAMRKDDKAASWALKSLDHARNQQQPQAAMILVDQLVPHLLRAGRYAEVIDIALDTSSGWEAISRTSMNFLDAEFDVNEILGPKPSERWNQAEIKSTFWGLLPSVFSILALGLDSREQAANQANLIASLCQQLASRASSPELWNLSSKIFFGVFSENVSARDLVDTGNKCRKLGYDTLGAIAYMCTSVKGDYSVQSKVYAQLAAMPHVFNAYRVTPSIYRIIILPFLLGYWLKKVKEGRFLFSNPNEVERSLEQAGGVPEEERAQHIFRTLVRGLGLRLRKEKRTWLYGSTTGSDS